MLTSKKEFMSEERSPLLWAEKKPSVFIGSAGHIRRNGEGMLLYPMDAHYLGVIWGVDGEIAVETTETAFFVRKNNVALIGHGTRFQVHVTSDLGEFLYLSVDGNGSDQILTSYDLWEGVFHSESLPFKQIEAIMGNLPDTRLSRVRVTLVEVLDLLELIQREHKSAVEDRIVLEAEILIHRHWKESGFSINAMCDRLQVSRSSLSLRFKKQTQKTMLEYLHDLRLKASMHLLRETAIPVSQVAYECGFSDPSYFSRFLKAKMGKTPQAFRP